jgi:hypothetical protein
VRPCPPLGAAPRGRARRGVPLLRRRRPPSPRGRTAECFDQSAQQYITESIREQHGSLAEFTKFLKLRFLLDPMSYEGDIQARAPRRLAARCPRAEGRRAAAPPRPAGGEHGGRFLDRTAPARRRASGRRCNAGCPPIRAQALLGRSTDSFDYGSLLAELPELAGAGRTALVAVCGTSGEARARARPG